MFPKFHQIEALDRRAKRQVSFQVGAGHKFGPGNQEDQNENTNGPARLRVCCGYFCGESDARTIRSGWGTEGAGTASAWRDSEDCASVARRRQRWCAHAIV